MKTPDVGRLGDWNLLHRCDVGEQAAELLLDNLVALADPRFKARSVRHGDVATVVMNLSRALQFPGRLGHTFAPYPQHVRDQFLGHAQLVGG